MCPALVIYLNFSINATLLIEWRVVNPKLFQIKNCLQCQSKSQNQ